MSAADPSGLNALDLGMVKQLEWDLGPDLCTDLIRQFVEETRERVLRMASADMPPLELAREAHRLKSTAATFGAQALSGTADALEQACRYQATQEKVDALRGAVSNLLEQAVTAYRARGYLS